MIRINVNFLCFNICISYTHILDVRTLRYNFRNFIYFIAPKVISIH